MIEVVELFNKINNLQSRLSFESQPRYAKHLTRTTQPDSIHQLDPKWLISNTASMNSTNSAHSMSDHAQVRGIHRAIWGLNEDLGELLEI